MRWLLALLLVACNARDQGATDLVLWHSYRGGEREALETAARDFAGQSGVGVRLVAIPHDAFADKLSVAVPRGNGPDLFIFAHDRLGAWAEEGLLESVGFWSDEALIDRFHLETVLPLVFRGELYGLPLAFKTLALYYDTTLVQAPPATTAELVAISKRLRAANPAVWGVAWDLDSLYFHAPWLHGFGGSVYRGDSDSDDLALGAPEAAASAAFVRGWLAVDRIIPEEATSALITALFNQHRLAFVVNGPWFRGEVGHAQWAVAPLPVVSETGKAAAPFLGVEAIYMSARSPRKKDAFALMRHLTSDEGARARFTSGAQLVANRAVYEDPAIAADPFARAFREQLAHTVSMSNRPHMRRVWSPMETALSNAIVHGRDAAASFIEGVDRISRAPQ